MLTSTVAGAESATDHPLTWTSNVLERLNILIVDARLTLPVCRTLRGTVPVNYSLFTSYKQIYSTAEDLELGDLLGRWMTEQDFATSDGHPIVVIFSPSPVQLQLPTSKVLLNAFGTFSMFGTIVLGYVLPADVDRMRLSSLHDDTAYYITFLIGIAQQMANSLGETVEAYPVSDVCCGPHVFVLTSAGTSCEPHR